jgi:hypothetical protein
MKEIIKMKNESYEKMINVKVSKELKDALEEYAWKHRTNISEVVRTQLLKIINEDKNSQE